MTEQEATLLSRLQTRVHQLILQDQKLQQQCQSLKSDIQERDEKIAKLTEQYREVSSQYANLKIAKVMELSDSDTHAAHRRLTNLVRQVDECIALLKSES